MSNLRKYQRAPLTQCSELEVANESVAITMYDISLGGVGFTSFEDIKVGDTVKVYYKILDRLFSDEVEVTHVRNAGHSKFYGGEFVEPSKASCDAIKRYVLAHGAREIGLII